MGEVLVTFNYYIILLHQMKMVNLHKYVLLARLDALDEYIGCFPIYLQCNLSAVLLFDKAQNVTSA